MGKQKWVHLLLQNQAHKFRLPGFTKLFPALISIRNPCTALTTLVQRLSITLLLSAMFTTPFPGYGRDITTKRVRNDRTELGHDNKYVLGKIWINTMGAMVILTHSLPPTLGISDILCWIYIIWSGADCLISDWLFHIERPISYSKARLSFRSLFLLYEATYQQHNTKQHSYEQRRYRSISLSVVNWVG